MPVATSTSPTPLYFAAPIDVIIPAGESIEITEDQAAQLAGHPWIAISPGTITGASSSPRPAPVVSSVNQPPQTAVSDEPAAQESEAQ